MNESTGSVIVVGVGECRIAGLPNSSLNTYALGSCLAVVLYDWKQRLGGILHAMLPDSSIDRLRSDTSRLLYVDSGVPELFRRFEARGGSRHRMRCCLVGGASMMTDPAQFRIGRRNHLAVQKVLKNLGVFVDCEDVGGVNSRSVRLDLATGRIELRKGNGVSTTLLPRGVIHALRLAE